MADKWLDYTPASLLNFGSHHAGPETRQPFGVVLQLFKNCHDNHWNHGS